MNPVTRPVLCSLNTTAAGIFETEVRKFYTTLRSPEQCRPERIGGMGKVKRVQMTLCLINGAPRYEDK